jgi:hypothetical protein
MQKNMIVGAVLILCVVPSVLHADEYTTMKEILITMAGYVGYIEDTLNQEIVHMQADIITTEGITFSRTLYPDWTYGITAFGDWRIKDLDIVVYKDVDGEWIKVEQDDEANNYPTVSIMPDDTREYLIELEVYKWTEDYTAAHYGLILFHEFEE